LINKGQYFNILGLSLAIKFRISNHYKD